jgi:hypothetical protein
LDAHHVASADFDARIHGFPKVKSKVASAYFDAPSVPHAVSANFDAPKSGLSYWNAGLATGHFDAGHHTRHLAYSSAILRLQTLMLLLTGFHLLVLQLSPPDWTPEYTTVLTIIFSLDVMAPSALLTRIMPEWKSHCTTFHLLGVEESLPMKTFLPGWTTTLTITILLSRCSGDRHPSRCFGSGASRSNDYHSYQPGGSANQNLSRGHNLPIRSSDQLYHHRSSQRGGSDNDGGAASTNDCSFDTTFFRRGGAPLRKDFGSDLNFDDLTRRLLDGREAKLHPANQHGGGCVSSWRVGLDAPILGSACSGGKVISRLAILEGPVFYLARGGGLIAPLLARSHAPAIESARMERGDVSRYSRPFLPTSSVANDKDGLPFCSRILSARSPYRHLPSRANHF